MATKLSAFIAVLLMAALIAPPQTAPGDGPVGSVLVKDESGQNVSPAPVVVAQYSRCWNGRCR